MRAWSWPVLAALGFGLMLVAYSTRIRLDPTTPWAFGFIVIGSEQPTEKLPMDLVTPARLRLLPGNERTETLLQYLGEASPGQAIRLQAQLRPKLLGLSPNQASIGVEMLQSGRLPISGRDEILAGAH